MLDLHEAMVLLACRSIGSGLRRDRLAWEAATYLPDPRFDARVARHCIDTLIQRGLIRKDTHGGLDISADGLDALRQTGETLTPLVQDMRFM